MTFLLPAFLAAAGAVAAAVVALHFIVTREPKAVPLPTARFAAHRPVRAQAKAVRPQDLLLLALRVALIMTVGAALAQPVLRPPRRAMARILLVDRSRAVSRGAEVADSARVLLSAGDAIVLFDSTATAIRDRAHDSLAALTASARRGRLSAALIAALRTASAMRAVADSFELAIISPLVAEELDNATDSVRALWPGAVRLVRVAARRDGSPSPVVALDGPRDDPLRLALPPPRIAAAPATVRIARGPLSAGDSFWVRDAPRVLVHWPAGRTGARGAGTLPRPWEALARPDTVGAVSAGDVVVVAPFVRYAAFPRSHAPALPRIVARWVDGEPAAIEERLGAGCIRTVTVDVPSRGDLVLQPRFTRLVAALTEPCGGAPALVPLDGALLAPLAGPASRARVAARAIASPETIPSPLAPWLLVAALAFAAGELLVTRRAAGTLTAEAG